MLPENRRKYAALMQMKLLLHNKPKRTYVSAINSKRLQFGLHHHLMSDLKCDPVEFAAFFRMPLAVFSILLKKVEQQLQHCPTHRIPIGPGERLSLTLRRLATGESFQSLHFQYRCGRTTAWKIFHETCEVIYNVLKEEYLRSPTTNEWVEIAGQFWTKWQFPGCVGAVDGKHVCIKAPQNSGSDYYNYKGQFSVNLMAISDAEYRMIFVNVGAKGRFHDSTVFMKTDIGKALQCESINLPLPCQLPNSDEIVPCGFVGDNAFPMCRNIMTPFSGDNLSDDQINFNYRLSRARRCIENAFGLLRSKWRIFAGPIDATPDKVDRIILACVCLHNFLIAMDPSLPNEQKYCPPDFDFSNLAFDETDSRHWRSAVNPYQISCNAPAGYDYTPQAKDIRRKLMDFFRENRLPWQQ